MEDKGLRFNEGKIRYDLVPPYAQEQYARVLTAGAVKYGDRNWQKGMEWSKVIASMKRHIAAYEAGEDYDKETGVLHTAHIMCNAAFITEYYKIYPQGDDRQHYIKPRIGLDIDGVLADFDTAFKTKYNITTETNHWYFSYECNERFPEIKEDKDFWINIPCLVNGATLPIEPVLYCTHRVIPSEVTQEWIEKNNLPCAPVLTVSGSKVEALRGKVDIFIDDKYDNFVELNKAGICTYLYDKPYNRRYSVGHRRCYNLNQFN